MPPGYIFWSDDDNAYVAMIPSIPGISALANSVSMAAAELESLYDTAMEAAAQTSRYPRP